MKQMSFADAEYGGKRKQTRLVGIIDGALGSDF